jgi:urease accessory protein UreE
MYHDPLLKNAVMIFDRVIANLTDADTAVVLPNDWVDLHWRECFARAAKLRTRSGKEIRLLLPLSAQLRHGDLITNGHEKIAIEVKPCPVLLLHPSDANTAMLLSLGLGNLHAPVQLDGELLITIPDGPVEELLQSLGVGFSTEVRRFEPSSIAAPLRAQLASQFQVIVRPARG